MIYVNTKAENVTSKGHKSRFHHWFIAVLCYITLLHNVIKAITFDSLGSLHVMLLVKCYTFSFNHAASKKATSKHLNDIVLSLIFKG